MLIFEYCICQIATPGGCNITMLAWIPSDLRTFRRAKRWPSSFLSWTSSPLPNYLTAPAPLSSPGIYNIQCAHFLIIVVIAMVVCTQQRVAFFTLQKSGRNGEIESYERIERNLGLDVLWQTNSKHQRRCSKSFTWQNIR